MATTSKVKVEQMKSDRSRQPIANQFILRTPEGTYFQSYQSIIAFMPYSGQIVLDETYHDYSRTTSKYLTQFLGVDSRDRKQKIKSGEYKLGSLN